MDSIRNDKKTLTSFDHVKTVLALAVVALMVCGAYIVAVGSESSDADKFAIGPGDTGSIYTTWKSGDCTVIYEGTWTYVGGRTGTTNTGVLKVVGEGRMDDYYDVKNAYGVTTPWTSRLGSYGPYWGCTKVIVEEGVTHIGNYAFFSLPFKEVSLPSTLTSIGDNAFEETDLTSISIPDSVTHIGERAFRYCDQLTSIKLPNGIEELGN